MRKKLIVANWKMHGTRATSAALLNALSAQSIPSAVDVVVCAPFVFVPMCQATLSGSGIAWGAQNISEHMQGAYTGEISAAMLADFACAYVLVGHSERRALYGENDALVAAKLQQALSAGIRPILCVGETEAEHEAQQTEAVIARQINAALDTLDDAESTCVIVAYEPVWAIGSGKTATPAQAQAAHAFIRALWSRRSQTQAEALIVLYGGSVKADNARLLFAQPDVDGGLVGGAALDAGQFSAIINAAQ